MPNVRTIFILQLKQKDSEEKKVVFVDVFPALSAVDWAWSADREILAS